MNTISSHINRTIHTGGDLGDVDVAFEIHIDRTNAAILAVAEGLTGILVLRDHPIGPALVAVRDANLGYRAAVQNGEFDALVTRATRNDLRIDDERDGYQPWPSAPVIALDVTDLEYEGEDPEEA